MLFVAFTNGVFCLESRIPLSSPWFNIWLASLGCRRLCAPREQSGADLPSFCVKRFSAPEWHLRGQWRFSDSCHLQSGSVQTPCPWLLSLWFFQIVGGWSTLFIHICTFAVSTVLVSPPSLPRPIYSDKSAVNYFNKCLNAFCVPGTVEGWVKQSGNEYVTVAKRSNFQICPQNLK